jgi:hypothetical protein
MSYQTWSLVKMKLFHSVNLEVAYVTRTMMTLAECVIGGGSDARGGPGLGAVADGGGGAAVEQEIQSWREEENQLLATLLPMREEAGPFTYPAARARCARTPANHAHLHATLGPPPALHTHASEHTTLLRATAGIDVY